MDNRKHPKTVPIRKRQGETSRSVSNSSKQFKSFDFFFQNTTPEVEGTFIPVTDLVWSSFDFINQKFTEDETDEEDEVRVIDLQREDKPPLFLLFPDLCTTDKERLKASTSTTQVTRILKGQKADFRLLKPSKKLNPEQVCLRII